MPRIVGSTGCIVLGSDTCDDFSRGNIGADSRTHARHDVPVLRVFQDTWNIRPGFAHPGFDGMNRAEPVIPENAVSILPLSQHPFFPRRLAKPLMKGFGIHADKGGDGLNVVRRHIRAAESFTTVSTLPAVENLGSG